MERSPIRGVERSAYIVRTELPKARFQIPIRKKTPEIFPVVFDQPTVSTPGGGIRPVSAETRKVFEFFPFTKRVALFRRGALKTYNDVSNAGRGVAAFSIGLLYLLMAVSAVVETALLVPRIGFHLLRKIARFASTFRHWIAQ